MASDTVDDLTVESNRATPEEIAASLTALEAQLPPSEPLPESPPPEPPPPEEPAPEKAKQPRHSHQAKIDQAIAKQREAERRADQLAAELATLKAPKPPISDPPNAPEKPPTIAEYKRYQAMPGFPQVADFDNYDDFVDARTVFISDVRDAERVRASQVQSQWSAQQQVTMDRASKFTEKITAATSADPTLVARFDARITDAWPMSMLPPGQPPTFANAVAEAVLRSENPVDVMLHLSEHPDFVQRLSTLPGDDFFRELGRLDARFDAAPPGPAKAPSISRAQPPIKPVGSSPHVADADALTGDEDVDTYITRANAIEARRRRR